MATDSHQDHEQIGFFGKLFSKYKHPNRLPPTSSDTPRLITPRKLPRALSTLPFTEELRQLWEQEAEEETAALLNRECVAQLKRVRDIRVPMVISAEAISGANVTMELTLAGSETRGAYCAPPVTRTVTRTFGECRQLLKFLASCVEPNDPCGCDGSDANTNRQCVFRENMRTFLDTCWVHPPVVHGMTMEWGGGDGGVTAGIRKSVLTASLRVILAIARGEYDSSDVKGSTEMREVVTGGVESTLPPLGAPEQPVSTETNCRARFEVALVVRDFLQLDDGL